MKTVTKLGYPAIASQAKVFLPPPPCFATKVNNKQIIILSKYLNLIA